MIKQRGENEKEEKEKRKRKMRTKIIDGKIAERQEYIFLRLRVVLSHRIAHRQQPNTDDDGDDDWLRAQSARDLFFRVLFPLANVLRITNRLFDSKRRPYFTSNGLRGTNS